MGPDLLLFLLTWMRKGEAVLQAKENSVPDPVNETVAIWNWKMRNPSYQGRYRQIYSQTADQMQTHKKR